MTAEGSREAIITPLLSTHDFKVVCTECCVQENEITYRLKSVNHRCQSNVLLCKAKFACTWRPVSRRPTFPNPRHYEVCWFFLEGSGCTRHKNRCTFARSNEEATVWDFEKHHGLDHASFVELMADTEKERVQRNSALQGNPGKPAELFETLDLKAVCCLCCVKEKEITYTLKSVSHHCSQDLLLAKLHRSNHWRPISQRPSGKRPGRNAHYQVCLYFHESFGCTQHGRECSFARSQEECTVWNFEKNSSIDHDSLIRFVVESEANSTDPQRVAERILKKFSGQFLELCKDCFHGSPQKITGKQGSGTCSAAEAHDWNPILVHHSSESRGKDTFNQVRQLPPHCTFQYCSHVMQGQPCWHGQTQCESAHSEVEMDVWKAEETGVLIRQELHQLRQKKKKKKNLGAANNASFYCKGCLLVLTSEESFLKHCASSEHAQMISDNTAIKWTGRPPPQNHNEKFCLCERATNCENGDSCLKAHSLEELEEWLRHTKENREIRHNIKAQGLFSYGEQLLAEYQDSSNEVHVISEHVDDVVITCDEELFVKFDETNAKFAWNFHVTTERQLAHVALLKQEPGASFSLDETGSELSTYSSGEQFQTTDMTYDITVSFKSTIPGLYEQWLVLDFDMRPVLLQKIKVRVGQPSSDSIEEPSLNHNSSSTSLERWHQGNKVIIPYIQRTKEQEELLKEYKPPQISFQYKLADDTQSPLNHHNYKDGMHRFLYREEWAQDQVVSRLSFQGACTVSDVLEDPQFGMRWAPPGEIFCTIDVPYTLFPDTSEGWLFRRRVQSALIAPVSSSHQSHEVYEAGILPDTTSENQIHLRLPSKYSSHFKSNPAVEVQFRLNRLWFCEMHKAVDLLPDTERVIPDLQRTTVTITNRQFRDLNAKQHQAINAIVGNKGNRNKAPFLIYGPFGTGKTLTLATAAKELALQPENRVLICTSTNSSADLYVTGYLHESVQAGHRAAKPLRIKAEESSIQSTDVITLQYCHRSADGNSFALPDKNTLDHHRIVIMTVVMARQLHNLKLPEGYFTHILIDEASQMLECEALMALGLAGPNTSVVLAGDHMQMGPKLFSVEHDQRCNQTLLNRLFHYYLTQKTDAALKSKVIFNENYRSTKEIVDFVSTHFYVGKADIIKAVGNVLAHPKEHPLQLQHVRGECVLHPESMSWFNTEEVAKVVEVVQKIVTHWPTLWGKRDLCSICVLSEGFQVRHIRNALRKRGLSQVVVENIANVQGKQFRAVVLTAVHTRESLKSCHLPGLEFFNDSHILNTAMTRAQSQVVVIGDAAALCYFGKCSRIWRSYIDHCISKGSIEPKHVTKDFLENDIKEISKFHKLKPEEENIYTDAILKQLQEEYEQESEYSSDEDTLDMDRSRDHKALYTVSQTENDYLLDLCNRQPNMYKRGQLVKETFNSGYFKPFGQPNKQIKLKGRGGLGMSFSGDEVVVKISESEDKVVGITKKADSSRVLACTMEEEDHSKRKIRPEDWFLRKLMIPITTDAPKICVLISKKSHNIIPVWKNIGGQWIVSTYESFDEEFKHNHVFIVQVIAWKEQCYFPLGKVIDIIPVTQSLRILDIMFKIEPFREVSDEEFSQAETDSEKNWEDLRELDTFTVDQSTAENLDDAISVKVGEKEYEVWIHIADVARYVKLGDRLDEDARRLGSTCYHHKMFPPVMNQTLSLSPGNDRRVISLMVKVMKETDKIIGEPKFQLAMINSDAKLSYEDAEDLICGRSNPMFDTVKDPVRMAYRFAKAQRKARLKDWAYSQPRKGKFPGDRRSHLMIEELSILFNTNVATFLISQEQTMNLTPLRCQAEPDQEKVKELKEKHEELIPLCFHTRHIIECEEQPSDEEYETQPSDEECETQPSDEEWETQPSDEECEKQPSKEECFYVLTKVWEDIQSAAKNDSDIDKVVDLIATDDIHPQLLPVIHHSRKCLGKAYFIRSNSSPKATIGHYSLALTAYTHASSPIRRYIDVILHRLLRTVLCGTPLQYSTQDIDISCQQVEKAIKIAEEYEQKLEMISFAVDMRKQNVSKLAFIVNADPQTESFRLLLPFDENFFPDSLPVMYRDLKLKDQPWYDLDENCMILTWKRRIYSIETTQIRQEVKRLQNMSPCTQLPLKTWSTIVEAVHKEDWDQVRSRIINAQKTTHYGEQTTDEEDDEHFAHFTVQLKAGDTLPVQLTSEIKKGCETPTVQLLHIKPMFEVCVDHAHSPIVCFSRFAKYPSKSHYRDTNEYVDIWKPLCDMESAVCAVDESNSIIIEDLVVNFSSDKTHKLKGSFQLPLKYIKKWAIECNLARCLLCIRKRDQKLASKPDRSTEVDPAHYTWVAHGVTDKVDEPEKNSTNKAKKVHFHVSHLPMETIPDCVRKSDTTFTVEIIPKLLPDVRKENAVINIVYANDLVQKSALGVNIPKPENQYVFPRWTLIREEPPKGLPTLNEGQMKAVEKALENNFTLIQGPPGTGKTVVGAYIVYWFLKLNSKTNRRSFNPKTKGKKEVVLYCGPSNKSVDVVAEYLLMFGEKMKPLRVYSTQVEALDYPYPGCTIQFSDRSRQEHSKTELRSITLHHRIRENQNPCSEQIKAFDARIKRSLEKLDELTDEEVEEYKKLLSEARKYELERHDIILCTCTCSSMPSLNKVVSARQILIDECAMATEPQALIPLVCNDPEKIVLLGDHKQLRPIVNNIQARKLGMSKSFFERHFTLWKTRAVMLDIQYRMHEEICKFPSIAYYDARLRTAVERPDSKLLVSGRPRSVIFGDIRGKEISLVVTTAAGNENSKANHAERDKVVKLAKALVQKSKVEPKNIVILSPYNAQVSEIRDALAKISMGEITVTTITKSQGSEWSYVFISTVRSLPSRQIVREPEGSWLSKHVGFVSDPNQINVGITRAKEGLCIIGNQELLNCSRSWKQLLSYYSTNNSVTKAEDISVR